MMIADVRALADLWNRHYQPWADPDALLKQAPSAGVACYCKVHEDNLTAGFGAEIAATLAQESFFSLDAPIERLAMPDIPSPHSPVLLEAALPSVAQITQAIQRLASV